MRAPWRYPEKRAIMPTATRIIPVMKEIEAALSGASGEQKMRMLMGLTDLFSANQAGYGDSHVALFDDIMVRMMERIESDALVELSIRLAPSQKAPPNTMQRLARHDSVGVAGPVLSNCSRLTDDDLIEIAKTKSQPHLAMIARRPQLNEVVTDVLVDHGDADVANEVAMNAGARMTELTMGKLVMRADSDARLTESIFRRRDVSPRLFRQLVTQATEAVREKLMHNARPEQETALKQVLEEVSNEFAARGSELRNYDAARRRVATFSQDTVATRACLFEAATAGRVAETVVILSVLSGIAVEHIEPLLDGADPFAIMVLCRSLELPWKTAAAVITACHGANPRQVVGTQERSYEELATESAQRIVHFWQGRRQIADKFFAKRG
jgi:uncharacterized protein (DUF2336 family)